MPNMDFLAALASAAFRSFSSSYRISSNSCDSASSSIESWSMFLSRPKPALYYDLPRKLFFTLSLLWRILALATCYGGSVFESTLSSSLPEDSYTTYGTSLNSFETRRSGPSDSRFRELLSAWLKTLLFENYISSNLSSGKVFISSILLPI